MALSRQAPGFTAADPPSRPQRIFFALWPDAAARRALESVSIRVATRCGGRPVPAANLHLTLAFLGDIESGRLEDACRAAAGVRASAFGVVLDCLGSFWRARVAWAGSRTPDGALMALWAALAQALRQEAFVLERREFAPHLTLVRKLGHVLGEEPMAVVQWPAQSFALVESDRRTGRYRTLAQWPLGAT